MLGHAAGRRADGLSSYTAEVARGLRSRGHQVLLHHSRADGREVPVPAADERIWRTWHFKTVTVPAPGFRREMRHVLQADLPDIIHCSLSMTLDDGWVGNFGGRLGSATVVTFHLPFGAEGSGRARVMRELHRYWVRRLRPYQRLIVFTEDHRRQLAQLGVDPERIEVVPNAVDTEVFRPGASRLLNERLDGAGLVVGYAGRLDPEKGVEALLDGFREAELGPKARLIIAGGGTLEGSVRTAAASDPRILHLGKLVGTGEMADFWRAAQVFCLPSSAEGLSISLLEAMASGCAIAATPEGGLAATDGGGLALDPSDLRGSVASQLTRLSQDRSLRERSRSAARDRAVHAFGMDPMLDRLLAIYRQCMAERRLAGP